MPSSQLCCAQKPDLNIRVCLENAKAFIPWEWWGGSRVPGLWHFWWLSQKLGPECVSEDAPDLWSLETGVWGGNRGSREPMDCEGPRLAVVGERFHSFTMVPLRTLFSEDLVDYFSSVHQGVNKGDRRDSQTVEGHVICNVSPSWEPTNAWRHP